MTTCRSRRSSSSARSGRSTQRSRCRNKRDRGPSPGPSTAAVPDSRLRQRELQQQRALKRQEIIVGNEREYDLALRIAVDAQAFHVVDLVAEIRFKQNGPIDRRARLDLAERKTAHANRKPAGPTELALQQQHVAAG